MDCGAIKMSDIDALGDTPAVAAPAGFPERCKKCRGTGKRYYGRGTPAVCCPDCGGEGECVFKVSPEKRAHAREMAKARKARKLAESIEVFKCSYPEIWKWTGTSSFPFAVAMKTAIAKYGSLTENQLRAAVKCIRYHG